jgi:hypothetical protein
MVGVMSHRHRAAHRDDDDTNEPESIHPVNMVTGLNTTSETAKQFGDSLEEMDPELLDFVIDSIRTYDADDALYYTGKAIQLARKSEEYEKLEKMMVGLDGDLSGKLVTMFAMGFIAGGSCTLLAVDEGFIATMEDEDEGPVDGAAI